MSVECVYNLSFSDYRANKEAVSISELNQFGKLPALYEFNVLRGGSAKRFTSKALEEGKTFHTCILEPKLWKLFERRPDSLDMRTKAGLAYKEQMARDAEMGIEHIDPDLHDRCMAARAELLTHPEVKKLYDGLVPESSYFSVHEKTGLKIKARLDATHDATSTIIDLKTTRDAQGFEKSVFEYKYYRQAAFYLDMMERMTGRKWKYQWWTIETQAPFVHAVYEPDALSLEIARFEIEDLLQKFKKCRETGVYPGLPHEIKKLSLPNWYLQKTTEKGE
jgi:hypothetical protein